MAIFLFVHQLLREIQLFGGFRFNIAESFQMFARFAFLMGNNKVQKIFSVRSGEEIVNNQNIVIFISFNWIIA